jgi:hypothetical protein
MLNKDLIIPIERGGLKLFTVLDIARMLGLSPKEVRDLIIAEELYGFKWGSSILVRDDSYMDYLKEQSIKFDAAIEFMEKSTEYGTKVENNPSDIPDDMPF